MLRVDVQALSENHLRDAKLNENSKLLPGSPPLQWNAYDSTSIEGRSRYLLRK
jgi:hypothetical protein